MAKQFQVVPDDKKDDVMLQALIEEDQAAYTAISVPEGMDPFKGYMEGYDVLKDLER